MLNLVQNNVIADQRESVEQKLMIGNFFRAYFSGNKSEDFFIEHGSVRVRWDQLER